MGRIVAGQIKRSGDTPWDGARVSFRLKTGSYTTSAQYPQDRVEAITDASGNFSAELWCNSDGLLATTYICRLPDGDEFEFILPNGTAPITLSELRSTQSVPAAPQPLISLLSATFLTQPAGDGRYRRLGQGISAAEITSGLLADNRIPSSIARNSEIETALSTTPRQITPTSIDPGDEASIVALLGWLAQSVRTLQGGGLPNNVVLDGQNVVMDGQNFVVNL